jgi:hypothetical protein
MDIKLIVAFILVGLVCYIIGRLSARRGQNNDGQMLQTSALRNFNGPDSLNIGDSGTAALDSATLQEIEKLLRKGQKISAIRIYRKRANCELCEAKDAVESMMKTF